MRRSLQRNCPPSTCTRAEPCRRPISQLLGIRHRVSDQMSQIPKDGGWMRPPVSQFIGISEMQSHYEMTSRILLSRLVDASIRPF